MSSPRKRFTYPGLKSRFWTYLYCIYLGTSQQELMKTLKKNEKSKIEMEVKPKIETDFRSPHFWSRDFCWTFDIWRTFVPRRTFVPWTFDLRTFDLLTFDPKRTFLMKYSTNWVFLKNQSHCNVPCWTLSTWESWGQCNYIHIEFAGRNSVRKVWDSDCVLCVIQFIWPQFTNITNIRNRNTLWCQNLKIFLVHFNWQKLISKVIFRFFYFRKFGSMDQEV